MRAAGSLNEAAALYNALCNAGVLLSGPAVKERGTLGASGVGRVLYATLPRWPVNLANYCPNKTSGVLMKR